MIKFKIKIAIQRKKRLKWFSMNEKPVIFFDGVCGLCNGFVDFVIKHDKKNIFLFSPLQSEFAAKSLPTKFTQDLETVVLLNQQEIKFKAPAVIEICRNLGSFWTLAIIFKIVPNVILNIFYDLVSKYRYLIFGKKETCRIPSKEERDRFVLS